MNLTQKIAQLFIVGFHGTTVSEGLKKFYREFPFGGVILFDRNWDGHPEHLKALCEDLQRLPELVFGKSERLPLIISVDQEGGRVARFKFPFTEFPGNDALGMNYSMAQDDKMTRAQAEVIARELLSVGVNLNYAPVVDVNTNPNNPVIGTRAFSNDPKIVSRLALATIEEFKKMGLLYCLKHFPGHGDTDVDSHVDLPKVKSTLERLKRIEWVPYRDLIPYDPPMIMTAHVIYEAVDPDFSATLSSRLLTEILRNELKFKGVIISDDMCMAAIRAKVSVEDWVVRGMEAGLDILLVCHDPDYQMESYHALLKQVGTGIQEERVDASFKRILKLKSNIHPTGC